MNESAASRNKDQERFLLQITIEDSEAYDFLRLLRSSSPQNTEESRLKRRLLSQLCASMNS